MWNVLGLHGFKSLSRIALCLCVATASAETTVWYVDADCASTAPTGLNWANAFADIQSAIDAAVDDGATSDTPAEVWVAKGDYRAPTDPTVTMKGHVHLYGGFLGGEVLRGERDWKRNVSAIHGGSKTCVEGSNDATLDGFTVREGRVSWGGGGMHNHMASPVVANCIFTRNYSKNDGAAMHNYKSSPEVVDCLFTDNESAFQSLPRGIGGMYNDYSSPTLMRCVFFDNDDGAMENSHGSSPTIVDCDFLGNNGRESGVGGMFNHSGSAPLITDCLFRGNRTSWGGAISNTRAEPIITDCVFESNSADNRGGAMVCYASTVTLKGCVFFGNTAVFYGGGIYSDQSHVVVTDSEINGNLAKDGAGVYCDESSFVATNCILMNNSAESLGGAMYLHGGPFEVANCTLFWNPGAVAGIYNTTSLLTVKNSILWQPWGDELTNWPSAHPTVTHSCVEGGYAEGSDIITSDPLFVDWVNGDFRLSPASPCIDRGTSIGAPLADTIGVARPQQSAFDIGAYEYLGCRLTYTAGPNGAIDGASPQTVTAGADGSAVLAVGDEGHRFVQWSDGSTENPRTDTNVTSHITVVASFVAGSIWYVDADCLPTAPTGLNWDVAFTDIQSAIDAATSHGVSLGSPAEVWVAVGIYTALTSCVVTMAEHVHLYGGFVGAETVRSERDWERNASIIDGEEARRCVDGAGFATLDGFTVQYGYSLGNAAGMFNYRASPAVANCAFTSNSARAYGGGMYNLDGSSPRITNCVFSRNAGDLVGGAMCNQAHSSPIIMGSVFDENAAILYGGGGMYNIDFSSPAVTDCVFSSNTSVFGAAMHNLDESSPAVTDCTFAANFAWDAGGAMYNHNGSSPAVTNCVFSRNKSYGETDSMYNYRGASPVVTNCIFYGASSGSFHELGGGMVNRYSSFPVVTNCIFSTSWRPEITNDYNVYAFATVTYSRLAAGPHYGNTNIEGDPQFIAPRNDDFRLSLKSPCIDTGTMSGAPDVDMFGVSRPQGGGCDMGPFERLPLGDIDQNAVRDEADIRLLILRIINGQSLSETQTVLSDVNEDGVLDIGDVLALIDLIGYLSP